MNLWNCQLTQNSNWKIWRISAVASKKRSIKKVRALSLFVSRVRLLVCLLTDKSNLYLQSSPSVGIAIPCGTSLAGTLHLSSLAGAGIVGLGLQQFLIYLVVLNPMSTVGMASWMWGLPLWHQAFGYLTCGLTCWVVVPWMLPLRRGWYLLVGLVEFNEREYWVQR
jgi:hypothetical protein